MNFLPQTLIVEKLLVIVDKLLPTLVENDNKKSLVNALEQFKSAITPSAIYIKDVESYVSKQNIILTSNEAFLILQNASLDIDLNYTKQAVRYHVDEFIINSIQHN